MRELRHGLWHWQARHPEWNEVVSSYAIDDGTQLLLFDPLAVPEELEELAAARQPAVVLTAPWHDRDTQTVATTTTWRSGSRSGRPSSSATRSSTSAPGWRSRPAGSGKG